jgi:NitT/TauT family transport system ATP-binding protein
MRRKQPLVEMRNITMAYGTGTKRFVAVSDVSIRVDEGEFVALLGPSGCGKSTLLRIMTGLQKPSEGKVMYRGAEQQGVNPKSTIVFQTFALFPWLSVQHNVELGLKARGVPRLERRAKAVALLDKVGLDGFETAYPRELSGGMRQKVGFARAMAVEPELMCLDEPFSVLDILSAESLRDELLELWQSGTLPIKAILLVTHSIEEAVTMADRVIIMDKEPGRVILDLPVNLPYPRSPKSADFGAFVDLVYGAMAGKTMAENVEMGTAPGEPGRTRLLPDIDLGALGTMLDHLAEGEEPKVNIPDLASDLKADSNDILRLTDAAELLGYVMVEEGDISLTDVGREYATASITERKDMFAQRIRRLPVFAWLLKMLEEEEDHRLSWDDVQSGLEHEFPSAEAERFMDTVVEWGRYGELFAYDDGREMIYVEGIEESA